MKTHPYVALEFKFIPHNDITKNIKVTSRTILYTVTLLKNELSEYFI